MSLCRGREHKRETPLGDDPKQGGLQQRNLECLSETSDRLAHTCVPAPARKESPAVSASASVARSAVVLRRHENANLRDSRTGIHVEADSDPMTRTPSVNDVLLRLLFAGLATGIAVWNLWLASQHPLWPAAMVMAACVWIVASARWPGLWLFVLPSALPLANLSPWSGWLIFDEFDLMVAGSIAAEFAMLAWAGTPDRAAPGPQAHATPLRRFGVPCVIALGGLGLVGLWRGLSDAGAASGGLFQGYTDALNSVRVIKPLLYTLLMLPLLRHALRDAASTAVAIRRLTHGMLLGLGVVLLAVLWERAAQPGWLDFISPYRTVALFWEMHVGGAAIDSYLALATPFVAWALWSARSAPRWGCVAILAWLTEYACLTTFSRGVYVAILAPLVALGVYFARRGPRSETGQAPFEGRAAANTALLVLMLAQAIWVLDIGSFMASRVGSSEHDLRSRLAHWHHGIGLLHDRSDWLLGIGLGRFPAHYSAEAPDGELPGAVMSGIGPSGSLVRISGPRSRAALGGQYGMTQRVPLDAPPPLTARFDVRSMHGARLRLSVCEMHLLFERRCDEAALQATPTSGAWQSVTAVLDGPRLSTGAWYAPRTGVFSVSVLGAGTQAEFDHLSLMDASGREQLQNGDFSQRTAHWFPIAQGHYLPWHIDNLYLEVLIERGLTGLALLLLLLVAAAWNLAFGPARTLAIAPFLLASLTGAMTLGLVSSTLDVPRVALLLFLLVLFSLLLKRG